MQVVLLLLSITLPSEETDVYRTIWFVSQLQSSTHSLQKVGRLILLDASNTQLSPESYLLFCWTHQIHSFHLSHICCFAGRIKCTAFTWVISVVLLDASNAQLSPESHLLFSWAHQIHSFHLSHICCFAGRIKCTAFTWVISVVLLDASNAQLSPESYLLFCWTHQIHSFHLSHICYFAGRIKYTAFTWVISVVLLDASNAQLSPESYLLFCWTHQMHSFHLSHICCFAGRIKCTAFTWVISVILLDASNAQLSPESYLLFCWTHQIHSFHLSHICCFAGRIKYTAFTWVISVVLLDASNAQLSPESYLLFCWTHQMHSFHLSHICCFAGRIKCTAFTWVISVFHLSISVILLDASNAQLSPESYVLFLLDASNAQLSPESYLLFCWTHQIHSFHLSHICCFAGRIKYTAFTWVISVVLLDASNAQLSPESYLLFCWTHQIHSFHLSHICCFAGRIKYTAFTWVISVVLLDASNTQLSPESYLLFCWTHQIHSFHLSHICCFAGRIKYTAFTWVISVVLLDASNTQLSPELYLLFCWTHQIHSFHLSHICCFAGRIKCTAFTWVISVVLQDASNTQLSPESYRCCFAGRIKCTAFTWVISVVLLDASNTQLSSELYLLFCWTHQIHSFHLSHICCFAGRIKCTAFTWVISVVLLDASNVQLSPESYLLFCWTHQMYSFHLSHICCFAGRIKCTAFTWVICCFVRLLLLNLQFPVSCLVDYCLSCSLFFIWSLYCAAFYGLHFLITPLVSVGHCIVQPSMAYTFLLPLWYLLVIVLFSLLWLTLSYYPFGICWSLYCADFYGLHFLITSLVSFGHCIVQTSMVYTFLLLLWYLLVIVLCRLLWFTLSYYPFGICWSLYCSAFYGLHFLITSLVSFGHCIVQTSMVYTFLLPLWYLLIIVLYRLLWFTLSYYPFVIFWSLYCAAFYGLHFLITSLVSCGHCIVQTSMAYTFLLPLWYLVVIVLCRLLWLTLSYYLLGIFWSLYCAAFYGLHFLITPLVSVGHCIVQTSMVYTFLLPLWYLLVIVLCSLLWLTHSNYLFGIFWSLYCADCYGLHFHITPLVSVGHCIVQTSMVYTFLLPLWYLLVIVLCRLLWFTLSYYLFGIFWPLYFADFYGLHFLITPLVSFGHCIVQTSMVYTFLLPLWYLLVIVLCSLLWLTLSYYPFGICWSLYCADFYGLHFLITPLVSVGHCIVQPFMQTSMVYTFLLPLWYLLVIVLCSLLWLTLSYYLFGICWSLYCADFYGLHFLITPLVSVGHYIVQPSMAYTFLLPPWYLLVIVLCRLLWFTLSYYPFGICWSLYCADFYGLHILITSLVSFGHCIVQTSMVFTFLLPLWYLLVIVLCRLLWLTLSYYPFGICWSLYCADFYGLHFLITPLESVGHCIVQTSMVYTFLLPLWYLLVIVLCSLLWFTLSYYPFGICWSLYCADFYGLHCLITPLVSVGHCIVQPSMAYTFLLPLWYLLVIVLCRFLWFTLSYYPFGICWSLYCADFYGLHFLITPLVSVGHCIVQTSMVYTFLLPLWYLLVIVLCRLLWITLSYYPFGICWSLYCADFYSLHFLITSLVSFGHCILQTSMVYTFLLPLWYLLVIVLCRLLWFTLSYYPFGICWSLHCAAFYGLHFLITPLISVGHCIVQTSMAYTFLLPLWYLLVIALCSLLWLTLSYYAFGIRWSLYCADFYGLHFLITPLVSVGHCIVQPSMACTFLLPLWYLLVIVLCRLLWFTLSYYPFGICWSLYCADFYGLHFLIIPLVSVGHCIVQTSMVYTVLLPLWYLLVIVLCRLLWFTLSYYPFGICWSLYCADFYGLHFLITPLVSVGHCIVQTSMVYTFLLPLWYLLVIVLCRLLWFTLSYYLFGIFWSLYCAAFYGLHFLITPLVSVGHCIVQTSMAYTFLLPLWYLVVIVLCRLLWITLSYYLFGIFWSLYCAAFYGLHFLITSLVSVGHCIVQTSMVYTFLLPLWYLLVIVLCRLLWFTLSYYPFGICWSLYCADFYGLHFLVTPLVSVGHCIVQTSMVYTFLLPLWYLLVIVLCSLLWFTLSYYPFGICWSLYCADFYGLHFLITSLVSFGHCIVQPSMVYTFLLPLWYLLVIVLCRLLWFTLSYYLFGICWSLYCAAFYGLHFLITSLVSFGHCIVQTSMDYTFLLPLWYLLVIVLCRLLWLTLSYYLFGIFWSLYCADFYGLHFLIPSLVSFGHCIVQPSMVYTFLLPLWYLLVIVLCRLLWFTLSYYLFGILWSLYCADFYGLHFLITSLVSCGHCIMQTSMVYTFLLPLWYLLVIVLCSLLWFTLSYYLFGILWSLYCADFYGLHFLITSLVSFGHCIVQLSMVYTFLLPLWYLLVIVLCSILWFTLCYYPFGICWSLYCAAFYGLHFLITPLVSVGHCIVQPSMVYTFLLPLWYLLVIVLCSLLWFTLSYYPFGIFWSLYCAAFYGLHFLITPLASSNFSCIKGRM